MSTPAAHRPVAPDLTLVPSDPPRVSVTPAVPPKKDLAVPLTLSLSATTIKRARLLASARGESLSRLVGSLLDRAIKEQLATLLADITADDGGEP